jgi:hypothetical protein
MGRGDSATRNVVANVEEKGGGSGGRTLKVDFERLIPVGDLDVDAFLHVRT